MLLGTANQLKFRYLKRRSKQAHGHTTVAPWKIMGAQKAKPQTRLNVEPPGMGAKYFDSR